MRVFFSDTEYVLCSFNLGELKRMLEWIEHNVSGVKEVDIVCTFDKVFLDVSGKWLKWNGNEFVEEAKDEI